MTGRSLPPAVRRAIYVLARPVVGTDAFRRIWAHREARRVGGARGINPNHLLHIGNIFLSLREPGKAIEFYLAACQGDPETRWVSGRSLLDFAHAHGELFKTDLGVLKRILSDQHYVVPDLEKFLFKLALDRRAEDLAALIEEVPATRLDYGVLVDLGSQALAVGCNRMALEAFRRALKLRPDDVLLRQQIGVTEFLTGLYRGAEATFASVDHARRAEQMRWRVADSPYRVLDKTWFPAIGHVAFLDTYIKAVKLGWLPDRKSLLVYDPARPPAGWPLFDFFSPHLDIVPARDMDEAVDRIVFGPDDDLRDEGAREARRTALSQPFWYGPDADDRIRWYAPWGAAVEAAWKASGRTALFALTEEQRGAFRRRMAQVLGLPEDAWFVLLHVREPGFHANWHKHHAGTRNADIRTYDRVIDFVIGKGGWIVRGGDPSMTPLQPRERVIDYATHPLRSPEIDIYLCAECSYFVGTNSGFSVIPPLFGRRCALTNWSPIGIPNWYLDDIYIPKLVRRNSDGRHLTFAEMFGSFAGWSQFARDFENGDLAIEDNSAEDLLDAAEELHGDVFGEAPPPTAEDVERLRRFNEVALAHGGYIGSRVGYRFVSKYRSLLDDNSSASAGEKHCGSRRSE